MRCGIEKLKSLLRQQKTARRKGPSNSASVARFTGLPARLPGSKQSSRKSSGASAGTETVMPSAGETALSFSPVASSSGIARYFASSNL
ncbi:MAG TPA: hypothetical protein VFB55_05260 [Verrucomicrobiae bacterium]|nr:hypothetical protein [Verrucomicrobiae bacterium]